MEFTRKCCESYQDSSPDATESSMTLIKSLCPLDLITHQRDDGQKASLAPESSNSLLIILGAKKIYLQEVGDCYS